LYFSWSFCINIIATLHKQNDCFISAYQIYSIVIIYHILFKNHSTGYLKYSSVDTNSAIMQDQPHFLKARYLYFSWSFWLYEAKLN
jgi:hypothetical protein